MQEHKDLTPKEKARLAKNAYQREWAKKNPDKIKAYAERHYAKKYDEAIQEIIDDFKEQYDLHDANDDQLKASAKYYIEHDVLYQGGDLRE